MARPRHKALNWPVVIDAAIAIIGPDRLILDNTSRFGLHRRHVIRYGGLPDLSWLRTAPKDVRVDGRIFTDDGGTGHLWFWWKE